MIVYHGTTLIIQHPDTNHSKDFLDFGKGFYLTTFAEQAEKWAYRKGMRQHKIPIVNVYDLGDIHTFRVKRFERMNTEWLSFVCECRMGSDKYKPYDAVIGHVADDDVFKCINMYIEGAWDEARTLKELEYYKDNDQIALISQEIINSTLVFIKSYEVSTNGTR